MIRVKKLAFYLFANQLNMKIFGEKSGENSNREDVYKQKIMVRICVHALFLQVEVSAVLCVNNKLFDRRPPLTFEET